MSFSDNNDLIAQCSARRDDRSAGKQRWLVTRGNRWGRSHDVRSGRNECEREVAAPISDTSPHHVVALCVVKWCSRLEHFNGRSRYSSSARIVGTHRSGDCSGVLLRRRMYDGLEEQTILRDRVPAHYETASHIEIDEKIRRPVRHVERLIEHDLDSVLAC